MLRICNLLSLGNSPWSDGCLLSPKDKINVYKKLDWWAWWGSDRTSFKLVESQITLQLSVSFKNFRTLGNYRKYPNNIEDTTKWKQCNNFIIIKESHISVIYKVKKCHNTGMRVQCKIQLYHESHTIPNWFPIRVPLAEITLFHNLFPDI